MASLPPLTAIDLFCGAGGFSAGLEKARFEVVAAVDAWPLATKVHGLNFEHPVLTADVSALDADAFWRGVGREPVPVDLVVGGPPCQGFSVQRRGDDEDVRNDLVHAFARFVCAVRPRMFIMENVLGLLGHRGREVLARFGTTLASEGYHFVPVPVNAADYGVPQRRRRVLCFGWRVGDVQPFTPPAATHTPKTYRTVRDAIGALAPPAASRAGATDPLHYATRMSEKNRERLRLIPPGKGFESLPVDMRADCHKQGADRIGHRNVYGRLDPDAPSATITARFDSFTRGMFAHPSEDRNITLREGALLQTFPPRFRFEGSQEEIAALIGNAVPPLLAEVMAGAVADHLRGVAHVPLEGAARRRSLRTEPQPQLELFDALGATG